MTDFNNIARAQQQAQQGRQFYDAQRYESMRGQGQALMQGAQGFVENRQRQQAFDTEARQRQQSLDLEATRANAAIMQLQQELGMQQRDANMRLQEHEIQMQLMGRKLQMAQALDATDLGRAQVQQQQAAARMAIVEAQKAEDDLKDRKGNKAAELQALMWRSRFPGGPRDVFEAGFVIDETSPMGYRLPREGSTELEDFGKRIDQSRERTSATRDTLLMDRDRVSREIQRVNEQLMIESDPDRLRELEEERSVLTKQHRSMLGLPETSKRPAAEAKKPAPAQIEPAQIDKVAQSMTGFKMTPPRNEFSRVDRTPIPADAPVETKRKISEYLLRNADRIRALQQIGYDQDPERRGLVATNESAVEEFVSVLNNPRHPSHQRYVDALRAAGLIGDR